MYVVKYIYNKSVNKYIYKQLCHKNIIEQKGERKHGRKKENNNHITNRKY